MPAQEPEEVPLPEDLLGNDLINALPPVDIQDADIQLGDDPSIRLQTGVGGSNLDVNINRDGVTVQPGAREGEPPPR